MSADVFLAEQSGALHVEPERAAVREDEYHHGVSDQANGHSVDATGSAASPSSVTV